MGLQYWNGNNYQATPGAWDFGGDTGDTSANVSEVLASANGTTDPSAELTSGAGNLTELYDRSDVGFLNVTLPVSTGTLTVNGSPVSFQGLTANLTLLPGRYTISLLNYSNASASLQVAAGQSYRINLSGAGRTTFVESGLALDTEWGISIDGFSQTSVGSSLSFTLPNGSFEVNYSTVPGFVRLPSDPISLTIPTTTVVRIGWTAFTFEVPIMESGLPLGTEWWVNASGLLTEQNSSNINVSAANGSTPFRVGSAYEFVANPAEGSIVVTSGVVVPISVNFTYRPTYIVGSVTPTRASLTIGGVPLALNAGVFNDSVIPGSYALSASETGYTTQNVTIVATPGNSTFVKITLLPATSPAATPSSSGGPPGDFVWVGAGIAVVAVAAGVIHFLYRRRKPG